MAEFLDPYGYIMPGEPTKEDLKDGVTSTTKRTRPTVDTTTRPGIDTTGRTATEASLLAGQLYDKSYYSTPISTAKHPDGVPVATPENTAGQIDRINNTPTTPPQAVETVNGGNLGAALRRAISTGADVLGGGSRKFRGATSNRGRRGMADALRIGTATASRAATPRTLSRRKQEDTLGLNIRPGIGLQV